MADLHGFHAGLPMTSDPEQIRILIVDDHPLLREGIVSLVEKQRDMVK